VSTGSVSQRVCALVLIVVAACAAQSGPEGKAGQGTIGIGELLNARLLTISLSGHVEVASLPPEFYFTVSAVSPDGTRAAGYSRGGFVVVDQHLKVVWRHPSRGRNVTSLALSSDGARLAVAVAASGPNRWAEPGWSLLVVEASGQEQEFGSFSYNSRPEEPVTLTWDPDERLIAFNDKGSIRILDTKSAESRVAGSGLDPTWSPDGRWIAYRTADRRIALLDLQSGQPRARPLGMNVTSFAHWSPDSRYIFVDEDRGKPRECFSSSRFAVYEVATGKSRDVYDPCALRDWRFGWIARPDVWISAAKALEPASRAGR
jgi:dipeptidyl aminopeptidase/acylaminoacyl peptidase